MRIRTIGSIALAILAPVASFAQQSPAKPLLIRDVTVIDCAGHPPLSGMSILMSDGRIAAIVPTTEMKVPPNARVLEAHDKYLIPGLWNMHVHLGAYADGKRALSGYLAEGITGLRDMGSPLDDILRLRRETDNGTILGPHLVVAGPIVQGPLPFHMPVFISVKDAAAARQTVQELKKRGVDFIKVQDAIPYDIYSAVASEARLNHVTFVGHIAPTVLPEDASDLGQHSIEHLGGRFWGVLIGSSARESELHAQEVEMYQKNLSALEQKEPPPTANMRSMFTRAIVESYDPQKAVALIARFRKNNTWQCPTLVVLHTLWTDGETQYTSEDLSSADLLLRKLTELIPMMQGAGVGLLAGTDLPPGAKNGTIHDELAALVEAGLTPMQALETATYNSAVFLGKLDTLGTVEPGKLADLVLLDGNPLDDIHNTDRISTVIFRGTIISRPTKAQP
jgi:hypothetical protein